MGASIGSPLPSIQRKRLGSEKRRESIVTEKGRVRKPLGATILIAGLESQTRAHQTLNARRNRPTSSEVAALSQNPPPLPPPAQSLRTLYHRRFRRKLIVGGHRHASGH